MAYIGRFLNVGAPVSHKYNGWPKRTSRPYYHSTRHSMSPFIAEIFVTDEVPQLRRNEAFYGRGAPPAIL